MSSEYDTTEEEDRFSSYHGNNRASSLSFRHSSMSSIADSCFEDRTLEQLYLLIKQLVRQKFQKIEKVLLKDKLFFWWTQ